MHIYSFNPKTNFQETDLNQTCEEKFEMAVLARKFQKQADFFNKACKRNLGSLFLYSVGFSECNSTENVPKTIYRAKIV